MSLPKIDNLLGIEPIHWRKLLIERVEEEIPTYCGRVGVYMETFAKIHKVTCIACLKTALEVECFEEVENQNIVKRRILTLERMGYD